MFLAPLYVSHQAFLSIYKTLNKVLFCIGSKRLIFTEYELECRILEKMI